MKWLWDTIAGRTIVVLATGLAISLGVSQYLYQRGVEREIREGNAARLADRLIVLRETLQRLPEDKRDEAAHAVSGGPVQLHWSPDALAVSGGAPDGTSLRIHELLFERLEKLEPQQLIIGSNPEAGKASGGHAPDHLTLISLALVDGTWLNMSLAQVSSSSITSTNFVSSLLMLAAAASLLAYLLSLWLTRPLRNVAQAARTIFSGAQDVTIRETGTREIRDLVTAFNDLQDRMKRLVSDRTNMLAAMSHDLRTPLTRLRLRVETVGSSNASRAAIIRDIEEMEGMLDATLAFLRGNASEEEAQQIDLSAALQTITNDFEDAGEKIELKAASSIIVHARPQTLKRALTNLIQNAIKYAGAARVVAVKEQTGVRIVISDDGPGIPENQLETVFEPFVRLDTSRNALSGGHGLGLSIARTAIRLHGGEVTLRNRTGSGLDAVVWLPSSHPT